MQRAGQGLVPQPWGRAGSAPGFAAGCGRHSRLPPAAPSARSAGSRTHLEEQLALRLGPAAEPFLGPFSKLVASSVISKWVRAFKIPSRLASHWASMPWWEMQGAAASLSL